MTNCTHTKKKTNDVTLEFGRHGEVTCTKCKTTFNIKVLKEVTEDNKHDAYNQLIMMGYKRLTMDLELLKVKYKKFIDRYSRPSTS